MAMKDDPRYGKPEPKWPERIAASLVLLAGVVIMAHATGIVGPWRGSAAVSRSADAPAPRTDRLNGYAGSTGVQSPSISDDASGGSTCTTVDYSETTASGYILRAHPCVYPLLGSQGWLCDAVWERCKRAAIEAAGGLR